MLSPMPRSDPDESERDARSSRQAWTIWVVGLLVYLLAVFHRSSLAVAGLAAADRFDIGASQLATFTMLQLLVYAGMQIPVGLLVDRFGSRSVLLVGAMVLTLAQAAFAFADSYAVALLARLFVGLGDAMTFICVLRLVNTWFFPRQIPVVTQLTGVLGQSGAILAAVPMTWALSHLGWTRSYLLAASFGLVLVVALLVVVHDAPGSRSLRGPSMSLSCHRREPERVLGAPGHPAGILDALLHPVQRHRARPALGLPVLRARRRTQRGGRRPAADRDGDRGDDGRSGARLAGVRAAVAPLQPRPRNRLRDRGGLDGGARVAGQRAALAAAGPRRGDRRRRARVDDRLRSRADVEPVRRGWPAPPGSSTRAGSWPA